ncbi:MAG TPA: hypothetical protein VGP64_08705 [Polyangia bacterium]|jgi:hypothetical protein
MRGRTLKLTVALCGLAGAVYAADQAGQPPKPDVNQVIAQQLVNEGQIANAAPNGPADTAYTAEQMEILAPKYAAEMQTAIEHADEVRLMAYRSHDIIRMTCVDDKIAQMKTLARMAQTPMLMLRTFKAEPIVMRTQFDVISRAHDRVSALGAEVDACMGDNLDAVTAGKIQEEEAPTTIDDPTRPPSPIINVERPPEASPYN